MKKLLFGFALASFIISLTIPFSSKATLDTSSAKNYLTQKSLTPWSVMALTALNEQPSNLNFLKNISGSEAIHFTAPILAITATGNNPKTFSDLDLVAKLKSFFNNNQIGDVNSLNDDIFAILALVSAGENSDSQILTASKNYILSNQNTDGSWGFALGSGDTDMTAAGIVALKSLGLSSTDTHIQKALNYIKQNQTSEGGFLSSPLFDQTANSASTAWAVWAFNSLSLNSSDIIKDGKNPIEFLESAQNNNGYFTYIPNAQDDSFTPNVTAYTLIASSGKTLPLKIFKAQEEQFNFRIEGKNSTTCEGTAPGPTALDIVKNASASCGFTYTIENTQYGPYLKQINSDLATGLMGWQYTVNTNTPSVGSADYQLKIGDSVLWYFGSWDDKITRLTLSNQSVLTGQNVTATIEYKDSGSWKPLEAAIIKIGTNTVNTNQSGQAELSSSDGYFQIFGEKTGFVRSNTLLLKIGEPTNASATLSAIVGQVNGENNEIPENQIGASFTINSDSLNFGNLSKGQSVEKTLTISNQGSVGLKISSVIEGDSLFKEYLKIQNDFWKKFELNLNIGENKNITTKLSIPSNYNESGQKNGQIIFWAKNQD